MKRGWVLKGNLEKSQISHRENRVFTSHHPVESTEKLNQQECGTDEQLNQTVNCYSLSPSRPHSKV